ncbi:MAG: hypothetical protein U0746_06415 [Gemmataceae bacterium]
MITLLALAIVAGADQMVERAGVVASARVEPDAMALTAIANLTLTVEADAPLVVGPVRFAAPSGWSLIDSSTATLEPASMGRARWRQSFRLTPDRPGELLLQPPTLNVRAAGRQSITEIEWKPISVSVSTSLADATLDEAKGVTEPLRLKAGPSAWTVWLPAAIGILVVASIGYAVLSRRRKRSEVSPEDETHARLIALAPLDADGLATTMRNYLLRRRGVPADRRTTAELNDEIDADWRCLLERCDLAKYADRRFDFAEWERTLSLAQSLVSASLTPGQALPVSVMGLSGENASSQSKSTADATSD